jgi:hypothetical protein
MGTGDAYTLSQRDEGDVQNEHADGTNAVLDNLPPVVLAADRVSALAPVVERQTRAPDDRYRHDMVETECWQVIEVRPDGVVNIVHGGDEAPQAVDLRVVLVDLGDDEDDGRQEQRNGKGHDEGVS